MKFRVGDIVRTDHPCLDKNKTYIIDDAPLSPYDYKIKVKGYNFYLGVKFFRNVTREEKLRRILR